MTASLETKTPIITPEISPDSAADVAAALEKSQQIIQTIESRDKRFEALCAERNIDRLNGRATYQYWDTLARFTQERVAASAAPGENLQWDALGLVAAAPAFLYSSLALGQTNLTPRSRDRAKENVTTFNRQLQDFVLSHPTAQPSSLRINMQNITNGAFNARSFREAADTQLKQTILGMKQELGFGQLLRAAGYDARPSTPQEDRKGIDYVVGETVGMPFYIDVKTSLEKINGRQDTSVPYAVTGPSHITMLSCIQPSEFGDSFFISDDLVAQRAPYVGAMVDQARVLAA